MTPVDITRQRVEVDGEEIMRCHLKDVTTWGNFKKLYGDGNNENDGT